MAVHTATMLIAHGKVERGWLGVALRDLTPELARSLNMPANRGALVAEATQDGPADRAGLKKNDVIVSFEGVEVMDAAEVRNLAAGATVGQDVEVDRAATGQEARFLSSGLEIFRKGPSTLPALPSSVWGWR